MGVDFTTSMGYGIAWHEDEPPAAFKDLKAYEEEYFDEWFDASGLDRLGYCSCGDWMGGPIVGFIYVKGTEILHHSAREYSTGSPITQFSDDLDPEGKNQLDFLVNLIEWDGYAGWLLINNVS